MKQHSTFTIGIPAYNEEKNIVRLLTELQRAYPSGYELEKIIVLSDGSTDQTAHLVKRLRYDNLQLIHLKHRKGQAHAQNEIIKRTSSDYLLLLNADIQVVDSDFITHMLTPFQASDDIGIVSARVMPLPEKTFIEKVVNWSHRAKTTVYEMNPRSIYLCHGRARAFSKKCYTSLKFPKIIAEDAYSYLYAQKMGYRFSYAKNAHVYFRSPANLRDHLLQSRRFFHGKEELLTYFSSSDLKHAYRLPLWHALRVWMIAAAQHPILSTAYITITLISVISARYHAEHTRAAWRPSESSKNL